MNQRPAVFSHDRLVYTMANHCEREQVSYHTCKLLVNELQRIIDEELSLRSKLLSSGVRDVSSLIHLRPNRFDQLDEASANYDDQRTCHYCKYICYFTAVACQCSHSKVSCLRHSHFMCTCVNTSKYLMIWSTKNELLAMLDRVKKHCSYLSEQEKNVGGADCVSTDATTHTSTGSSDGKNQNKSATAVVRDIAPGVQEDYERHKNDPILTDPRTWFLKQI
jgi:C5HC2 zinc finger